MTKSFRRPAIAVTHEGTTYEMRVQGYQFETFTEDFCSHDRNWLNVSLRVKNDQRDAVGIEASVLSWELDGLAKELSGFIEDKEEEYYESWLTEDDIRLKLWKTKDGGYRMEIIYSMWAKMSDTNDSEFFRFGATLTEQDLRNAIRVLEYYSKAFPIRD